MATLIAMASLAAPALAAYPGMNTIRQTTDATDLTVASNMTLAPINCTAPDQQNPFAAQSDVTLPYGLNNTNYVNITLTVPSAVLLETIDSLASIDCAADSVTLSFNSTDSLDAAYASWSAYNNLVLITNHLGDCDTEYERSFFVANSFAISNSTLVATAQKTNVSNIATYMRANFTGLPGSSALVPTTTKRVVVDPDPLSISNQWDLSPSLTLFQYDPYVTATAKSGSVAFGLTLDGYLDFEITTFSLKALYVDTTTTVSTDLVLDLAVNAPYSNTFSYSAGVSYYGVNIPGILTFGPGLSFAVGAAVDVDAAIDVTLDIGAEISNGTMHLDFVGDATSAAGWTPTYHADLTLSEKGTIGVTPFVSLTAGLEFEILGGLLNLGGGLTPKVEFPVTATLSAGQLISGSSGTNVTVTPVGAGGTCSNGVLVASDFDFTLDAFVTQFWNMTLYDVTVPIADNCYAWA